MKELLSKLIKNYVAIGLKSGDKIEGAIIEAVTGNVVVVTYNGSITIIEISQIVYVTPQAGIVEVVQSIFSSDEGKQEVEPEELKSVEVKLEEAAKQEEVKPEEVKQEDNNAKGNDGQVKKKKKHHHHHHH